MASERETLRRLDSLLHTHHTHRASVQTHRLLAAAALNPAPCADPRESSLANSSRAVDPGPGPGPGDSLREGLVKSVAVRGLAAEKAESLLGSITRLASLAQAQARGKLPAPDLLPEHAPELVRACARETAALAFQRQARALGNASAVLSRLRQHGLPASLSSLAAKEAALTREACTSLSLSSPSPASALPSSTS